MLPFYIFLNTCKDFYGTLWFHLISSAFGMESENVMCLNHLTLVNSLNLKRVWDNLSALILVDPTSSGRPSLLCLKSLRVLNFGRNPPCIVKSFRVFTSFVLPGYQGGLLASSANRCGSGPVLLVSSFLCLRLIVGYLPLWCWLVPALGGLLWSAPPTTWCRVPPLSPLCPSSIAKSKLWVDLFSGH